MVNTATSNEQQQHHHHEEQQNEQHLHQPEPLNDPSGILSNSPNFAAVNGIQIFEPIYQPNIAEKNLKVASVTLPNGHKRDFHIHKNSKGNVLFDLAAESETLLEKDYFGLRYEDELGEMTWLYPDKRIQKQLKHKPWNFVFQIKFYPPEPSALADDLTRYLLYLQIRKEIYEGKLPASYAKQILLAAMVMQAEIGDFEAIKQSPHDYERFLREQHLIPQIDEEVLTKVREAHKEQKGLTPNEAHQKYLDTAKDLAKYGFTFFNAKDTKNGPVIIGVYAHGICVYKDQLQIHRFLWQGVNKIQFRGSKFSVVLKPGELDPKKEVTVNYRLADYTTAKKLYRTAVEHHTFFRLIKPEDKPKGTFLRRWGSDRFRYQGRTYFQAKMASQMFDHPSHVVTIQRTPSGRQVSRSVDDLAQPRSFPTSPMHYVDETTQQLTSPEKSKSYSLSTSKADKAKKKAEELSPLSVVVHDLQQQQQQKQQQGKSKRSDSMSSSGSSSPCSVSMASPNSGEYYVKSSYTPQEKSTVSPYEEVIFPLSISKEERQQQYQTPIQRSSANRNSRVRFSSDTKPVTPDDGSAVAMAPAVRPGKRKAKRRLFGPVNDDHTAFSPVDDLYKAAEISSVPLDSRVTLYDKGWYTTPSTSRALSPTGLFVGCCKPPRRTLVSERLLRNCQNLPSSSSEYYSIIKRPEIEPHPIRYFVEVYHSGRPQIETRRKRRFMPRKDVDFVNPNELNKDYYNFPKEVCYDWERTECSRDPEGLPLKQFSTIYWLGGTSKQGNAKPVGIKGQNIIVPSESQQHEGEGERRMIITEASTSKHTATEEEPRVVEIVEEKPVITVRQEEGKTITTIETTTVITTTENFESGTSEAITKENVLPLQVSTPSPSTAEQVQATESLPTISEPIITTEIFSKAEELDAVPIKKYSNVYHAGTSVENPSPVEWVKKKKGILFIKKSSTPHSQSSVEEQRPSTSKETTPESGGKVLLGKRKKSSEGEPIVAKLAYEVSERARTFSMSKHYPEISKPFEGQLKEIQRDPEAPSANLFDCVSFANSVTDEPKTKKAKQNRAARFCLACVGGSRQRREIERKHSKTIESHAEGLTHIKERETRVEEVYVYEPTNVTEVHETVETMTKTKKYDKIPEVIVTHDLSLIPATSDEELITETLPLQSEDQHANLSEHVEIIPEERSFQEEETITVSDVTVPPTPTPSEATFVEENVQQKVIKEQTPPKMVKTSEDYPFTAESNNEVDILEKHNEAPQVIFLKEQSSAQEMHLEKQDISMAPQGEKSYIIEETHTSSNVAKPLTIAQTMKETESLSKTTITTRTKMLAEKKHYPLIGATYEGETSKLPRQEDFREANLFDTISFQSGSDDSGLGADSGPKQKSGGLICIPKSKKSKTKTSETTKKINYTEVQTARNKKVKRARLFSFSKNYPEIGTVYEGEVNELVPIQQAPFTNLFDEISFAPDEEDKIIKQETATKEKPKSSGLWCLPTSKQQKRTASVNSIKSEELIQHKPAEKAETYSLSQYYPELGTTFEGELSEVKPVKDVDYINIFDAINFAPKQEKIEVVEVQQSKEQQLKSKKDKSSTLLCMKKRKTSETSSASSLSLKDHKNLQALQTARNKIVRRARLFSFSKHYPEIGGGEIINKTEVSELAPVQQAPFTNLFDEISFASDETEIKNIEESKKLKTKKSAKKSSNNLLCGTKSKRKSSEKSSTSSTSSGTSVSSLSLKNHKNLNAMQIARNKLVQRARYFSISKHYPEIGAAYAQEGEEVELQPAKEPSFTKLFDVISFASTVDIKETGLQKIDKRSKALPNCFTCAGFKSKPTEITEKADEFAYQKVTVPQDIVLQEQITVRDEEPILVEYVEEPIIEVTEEQTVKVDDQLVTRVNKDTNVTKTFTQEMHEQSYNEELIEIGLPIYKSNEDREFTETIIAAPPERVTVEAKVDEPQKVVEEVYQIVKATKDETKHYSEGYPAFSEPYTGKVSQLSYQQQVPETVYTKEQQRNIIFESPNPNLLVIHHEQPEKTAETIQQEEQWLIGYPRTVEEKIITNPEEELIHTEMAFKSQAYPSTGAKTEEHRTSSTTKTFSLPWSKKKKLQGYPMYTEAFDKDVVELRREPEAPERNLFDTISFQSNSDDSGLGADSGIKLKKSGGIICIPKSKKSKTKTSETTKKINYTEVQTARNKKVKRARLFSFSKNYPEIGTVYEGEVNELVPIQQAPFTNLFDEISFAPDEEDKIIKQETATKEKPKSSGLWCLPTSKQQKRTASVNSIKSEELIQHKPAEKAETYSLSQYYPELGTTFEGELSEVKPVKDVDYINIFDAINFAPKQEKIEVVEVERSHQFIKEEPKRKSKFWCVPGAKKRKASALSTTSDESIEKGTLNALQVARNKIVQKARTFSMSDNYPNQGEAFLEELMELSPAVQAPSANLFDCVSFDDEPPAVIFTLDSMATLNKNLLPRERPNYLLACLSCGTRKFRSPHYPAITEPYDGEVTNLQRRDEIPKTEISEFVSVPVEKGKLVEKTEQIEVEKSAASGYPGITEAFTGELNTIYPQRDVDLTNLNEYVAFENGSEQLDDRLKPVKTAVTEVTDKWAIQEAYPVTSESNDVLLQEPLIEESILAATEHRQVEPSLQPPEVIITEATDLTPKDEIPKSEITEHISFTETGEGSYRRVSQVIAAQKHIIISDEAPEMISAITNMDELTPAECYELSPVQEAPSKNLFDTISFQSGSDDSGLGADSETKSKKKSGGLICIPKSKKSKTKTSETTKKINYTEVQTARNKKVKRARLFSFSKNYPEIGTVYEGEVNELTPVKQAAFTNLFDEISFAPDEEVKIIKQETVAKEKPKSSGLWCLPTSKQQKRTASVDSIKSEESIPNKTIEKAETYSLSQYYPERGTAYEGELSEVKPVKDVDYMNIFDAINFAPKQEKIEVVEVQQSKEQQLKSKKDKSSTLLCMKKRKTSETSSASSLSLKDHKNLHALQTARNKFVRRARYFSTSKYYPEIGIVYDGEMDELKPVKQAAFTNLFDEISFAPDEVEIKHDVSVADAKRKHKSAGRWCVPGSRKQKRTTSITSEESIKKGTLNKIQIARNKAVERARTFSMSHHYPEIETAYEGELSELAPSQQAQSTNLFDEVDFEPDVEEKTIIKKKERQIKPLKHTGISFLWCAPKHYDYSSYPSDRTPYSGELKELTGAEEAPSANLFDCVSFASTDDVNQDLLLNGHVVSQPTLFEHQQPIIIEQESVTIPYGYPVPTEVYDGEVDNLEPQKDYDHINIYERIEQVPKGISYVPPPRKPSFLEKIRRASFRETSTENVSFERKIIREEVHHVGQSAPMTIPTIIEPVEILEKTEETSSAEMPVKEEVYIVEEPTISEPTETTETFHEQTMETVISLTKSGDVSYYNETTIIPDVFITETVKSDKIPAIVEVLKHYPVISEPFTGELSTLTRHEDAPSSDLFDEINFLIVDKNIEAPITTKASKAHKFLWCGGQRSESPKASKSDKAKSFRNRVRTFSMSKYYPEIAAPFEGELLELTPTNEAPSRNLFDEINFASAESEPIVAVKEKSSKIRFWCLPTSKQQKRTASVDSIKSEESIPNKTIEKAETYSLSQYYPERGTAYEGELSEVKPVKDVDYMNIFDAITFAPKHEKIEQPQLKPNKDKSSTLLCMKKRKTSETSSASSLSLKDHKNLHALQTARNKIVRRARLFSFSKHYPEIGGGEIINEIEVIELAPVQQAPFTNLFDEISFAPDEEVKIIKQETATKEKPKSSGLWCLPTSKQQKRTASVDSIKSEELIQHKPAEKAETYSLSQYYPELGTTFEGELSEVKPVKDVDYINIFDAINFAPKQEKIEVVEVQQSKEQQLKSKKDKSSTLLCMKKRKTSETSSASSLSLKDHKNLQALQTARNKIVRRARLFSFSKHYPEIGGGEIINKTEVSELAPVQQAPFTNLFDEISFASDETEIKNIEESKKLKTKKSAKKSSNNLLCGTKLKRKSSEKSSTSSTSSGTSVSSLSLKNHKNLNAMQIARNKLVQRARYFSISKHYPEIGAAYAQEGEEVELQPAKEPSFTKLFDEINFASEVEDVVVTQEVTKEKQSSKAFAACLACTGRKTPKSIEEPYEVESIGVSKSLDVPSLTEFENASTLVVVEKDVAIQSSPTPSVEHGYPLISEPYTGELSSLSLIPEMEYSSLPKMEREKAAESLIEQPYDEVQKSENIFTEEREWVSGMPEVIQTERHHEIISTHHITRETALSEHFEAEREPVKTLYEQVLSDYPQLAAAYHNDAHTLTKISEVQPVDFETYEQQIIEPTAVIERTVERISEQQIEEGEHDISTKEYVFDILTVNNENIPTTTISKRTTMLAEKRHYPLIGATYEGETSKLPRQEDFREANLFDTISFQSDSDDSGLGADSETKSKKKSGGLICIPKSKKSKTKTSETTKKINYTEVQTARNKKVKRARLFSFSKNYPEIGTVYEGEVNELVPIQQAPFTNLFDEISFAPDEEDKIIKQETATKEKPKSSGLWCLPTSKQQKRTASVNSIKSEELIQHKPAEKAETYSLSQYYPERGTAYEGELYEVKPVKDVDYINIFDAINFAPKQEKIEVVEVQQSKEQQLKSKKDKSSTLLCMKKRKTSETSSASSLSLKDHKNLHALQTARNKFVRRARYFSTSKYYPEIGIVYDGKMDELKPVKQAAFTNLFDEISFAPDEVEIKHDVSVADAKRKHKSAGRWCVPGSRKQKRTTSITSEESIKNGTLNKIQIARNKAVERARTFSMSHHYPEIGTAYEGELSELAPSQQAQSTNLFDEVDFEPDVEEKTVVKTKEYKKSVQPETSKITICAPFKTSLKHYPTLEEPYSGTIYDTKLKEEVPAADLFKCVDFASSSEQGEVQDKVGRMQSEERQIPRKQMATLYFRRNTKQLEGYPIISEAYKGEIAELLRHPEVEITNLFDCVTFASESDDEIPISQSSNARDSSKKGSPDKPKKKQLRLFGKTRRSTSDKELDLTLYPKSEEAYSGPLSEISKAEEIDGEKLRKIVTIYHSGYSQPLFRHRFIREKYEGIEEIGEAPADYEILYFTAEDTTPMAPTPELEALPLRSYAKYPIVCYSESPRDMKRKFSKSKIIPESSSESSSQSESETDTVPSLKPSSKKKESEGFLSFFKNRLTSKQQQRKRTGYEGLVESFSGSYETTPKGNEMSDQPILEHVLVYHNGSSTQQPIDSGFEDGANASETERAGTFKRTGKLFFDKFKLSRDSGDKTTTEEIDKSESLEPKKPVVLTGYENLNTEPFLGLHSSTVYSAEVEQQPLTTVIDTLPVAYYHDGDATLTPVPPETTETTKVSTLERIIKSKKPRKDSNFAFLSIEGPVDETDKKGDINDLPIGEHVTVYHCGRSDVPTAEVPPEVYVYEKEPVISESLSSLPAQAAEQPQISQTEHVTHVQKTKRESLKRYPEPFTYEGPLESLDRLPEAEKQNVNEYVNIYHSGYSTDIAKKNIPLIKQESKTEKRRSSRYSFDTKPFEGEVEQTFAQKELAHLPLREHALTYHPGKSEVQDLEDLEEREIKRRELSLIQRLMAIFKKRELQGYPSTSEEYTGPIEEITRSEDVEKSELKNVTNVYHSGYSYDPKTSKLTLRRFAPRKRLRVNMNDYPKDSASLDAVIYDLHTTEDIPKTPSPVTLPPESLIFNGPLKQRQPSRWYRFWFLRRRGQSQSTSGGGLEPYMPIVVEAMSHRITDTSSSIIMATTDRSLFAKGHWPVTDIDVDVMLKTITKCQCECEALIIEKTFETGIAGSIQLQQTLNNDTSFRMDNNCIMQTSNGTWLAKVTKKISTQMEQIKQTDNDEKAELFAEKEKKNEVNDEVPQTPSVEEEEVVAEKEEDEIEIPRHSTFCKWDCEPPYLWSSETFEDLEELIDDNELNIISKESGELPLTHEKKELKESSVCDSSEMFASIRRRLSEKLAKKEKKKEEKRLKKEEKERKKHAAKSGATSASAAGHHGGGASTGGYASESSSSSASVSDAEIEERHVVISKAIEGPVQSLNRGRELGDLDNIEEDIDNNNKKLVKMAPQTSMGASAVNNIEANSSGPYTPAKDKDGRIIREETVEQVYRISGTGHAPNLDPNDMSLQSTVDKCIRDTERMPRVQMVEANVLVKECEPLPHGISEGSAPHTTLHSWHETEDGPETVTTEVDEHGNKITRTIKTQTTKHTIQKQTYQTYAVEDKDKPDQTIIQTKESTIPLGNKSVTRSPVVHTKTRTVAYEKGSEPHENIDPIGELVSTKTITTGNRTVEILTYKTEKDGVIETRVEHRVTIHSGDNIDHDAELAKALLEATEMSPDLIINRVEVEKQTQR